MRYKKLMMLAILLVSLLAVSAVNAAENTTGDVVGVEQTNNHIMLFNNESVGELKEGLDNVVGNDDSANDLNEDVINAKIEVINCENQYKNGAFKFKVTDIDNASKSFEGKTLTLSTMGGVKAGFSAVIDENNTASFLTKDLYEFDNINNTFDMKELTVGKHTVEVSAKGDVRATPLKVNLTITKADITIKIDDFKEKYGTDKNVTITVINRKDGAPVPGIILHLYIAQTGIHDFYFQTDSNGQSHISVTSLIGGTYDLTVKNNDTENINLAEITGKIIILPAHVRIVIPNTSIFKFNQSFTFKVIDENSKGVPEAILLVSFNGDESPGYLLQADENGTISFIPSLDAGEYRMKIYTADNRYEASTVTRDITIEDDKEKIKIKVKDIDLYYSTTYGYIVSLADEYGDPVDDVDELKVVYSDGEEEIGEFDGYGDYLFSMDKIANRKATFYLTDSSYRANPVTINVKISKSPVKISTKTYYSNTKQTAVLKATVKDSDGEPIREGRVQFKINGKTYNVKVAKGVAVKKIKLTKAKTYAYSAAYLENGHYKKSKISKNKVYVYSCSKKTRTFSIKGFKFTLTQGQYNKLINAKNTGKKLIYKVKTNKKIKQTIKKDRTSYKKLNSRVYARIGYALDGQIGHDKYWVEIMTDNYDVVKGKLHWEVKSSTLTGLKTAKPKDKKNFVMI